MDDFIAGILIGFLIGGLVVSFATLLLIIYFFRKTEIKYYIASVDILPNTNISKGENIYYEARKIDLDAIESVPHALADKSPVLMQDKVITKKFIPQGTILYFEMFDYEKEIDE